MSDERTDRWVCWIEQRFYTKQQHRCIRAPGDRTHEDCGWYELRSLKETP